MSPRVCTLALLVLGLTCLLTTVSAHGRLKSPASRSSMWRYGYKTPHNTNDHQLSCGGFGVMQYANGGKCGVCGDPWNGARDNEAGGKYATGTIVGEFKEGETIPVELEITVYHGGWSEFRVCPNNDPSKPVTQECLDRYLLKLSDGTSQYKMKPGLGVFTIQLVLPRGLSCSQCVLQWRWNTASNVGCDQHGKCCRGCGPQEQFYGCADISIGNSGGSSLSVSGSGGQYKPIVPNHSGSIFGNHVQPVPAVITQGKFNQNGGHLNPGSSQTGSQLSGNQNAGSNGNEAKYPGNQSGGFGINGFVPIGVVAPPVRPAVSYLPSGFQAVPLSPCRATTQFRAMVANADNWCKKNCAVGYCPKNFCGNLC